MEKLITKAVEEITNIDSKLKPTNKILERPPFSFLHKLLSLLFRQEGIFTSEQLDISTLTTKDLKAGFLVKALAYVAFVQEHRNRNQISCLLLMSPIKILAGLDAENTVDFLLQAIEVFEYNDSCAKTKATSRVLLNGEKELYTVSVQFREGMVKFQRICRKFLEKNKDQHCKEPNKYCIGLEFKKEFEGYGIYTGVIRSFHDGIYVVQYIEDGDEEELDELELEQTLENSKKFSILKPIPIISELSKVESEPTTNQEISATDDANSSIERGSANNSRIKSPLPNNQDEIYIPDEVAFNNEDVPWQKSFQEKLKISKQNSVVLPSVKKVETSPEAVVYTLDMPYSKPPSLPKLHVPGGISNWKKRMKRISVQKTYNTPTRKLASHLLNRSSNYDKNNTLLQSEITKKKTKANNEFQCRKVKEDLFAGLFDDENSKANSRSSKLFERIISSIDRFLKRRRMRVVDCFNACDLDGNGSISGDELNSILKHMDIRLNPKEAKAFMNYVDKDGNGEIDIDEFESLIRISRRNKARREQLVKEVVVKNGDSSAKRINLKVFLKYKQRLYDAFKTLDSFDNGSISSKLYRDTLHRLDLKGISTAAMTEFFAICGDDTGKIVLEKMKQLLSSMEEGRNEFLDKSWITQFDSQLERVMIDFEHV